MSAKAVLITGAAGFVGARLVESFMQKGWPVISVDKPEHFQTRAEHRGINFGRIVDRENLFKYLEKEKPDLSAVFHIGACTDTTQLDAAYLRRVNLEYSKNIWQYCHRHCIPLIYASSAATYGAGELGFDDDEALIPKLKPLNPYGQSKQDFDDWVLVQEREGKTPPSWCGFKFFNVYGFGERHKGRMASVALHAFDQIRSSGKVRLFKSHRDGIAHGHQKRDFIYVRDVVEVLHFAFSKPISRGIFNLGTGRASTFLDLVAPIFQELKKPQNIEFIDTPEVLRERYQYFTEAKMDKLRKEGYTAPFTSLHEGIADYVRRLLS